MNTEIPKDVLWQFLTKKDLDPKNEITDDQWIEFIDESKYSFCDEVSEIAQEYFAQWKEEKN